MNSSGLKGEQGISLLEVVIAIAVLGLLLAGFIPALLGITRSVISVDGRETAKNLAESELEYVKAQPYLVTYHPYDSSAKYPGFSVDDPLTVSDNLTGRDSDIQAITVVVRQRGAVITQLTGYKVN